MQNICKTENTKEINKIKTELKAKLANYWL
jgi:hypothetical protein